MSDQRQAIRENAQYLRNVRPIDPEEIYEYVEGQPHPGVVRTTLRELAPELDLIEREDGTFVPAPEGPVSVDFDGVEAFPERYARALEDLLVETFGPGWPEATSGDRLRERLVSLKDAYFGQREVAYDELTALAYAIYHLPDTYAATQYVLADLAREGRLPSRLRVLEIGAGTGGPALGLADLLPEDALLDYHAVEPSDNADVLERMLEETGRNVHATVHRERAETFDPDGEFDLLVFANVLNELDDPASVLRRYRSALASDGSLVAIEPADRNTATGLRRIERAVEDEYTIYAPTCRLWPGMTPDSDCWSFDRKPDLAVPPFQRRLESAAGDRFDAGAFENVDVQYAFSILRTDGAKRIEYTPDRSRVAPLAEAESLVTDRIDLVAIKLSHDLSEGGNPLFLIGDGSENEDVFAVLIDDSSLTRPLAEAPYGALLDFENVLVLWNDDEEAYNLVVDDEVVVDAAR
ncbi:small ribosomal subunit Rsm22 family protein [Halapricum hydrolyticum]|uniref:Class I SAM-dependent methyltransferase n=1 Tax=Halapricum hydrolyticum TaxID=2979991 RepID=A0AAE3LFP4_9EURY|nr:methyltransferase [Halapricum hydrolyticum]MCU4719037.1 class I SAM-dependent methyltransferase [Halapricum hydrolyticum]MCU4728026.1 class I SAM-dependent methyltransferase [Halapricum hydrolyticum]